jgi:hypothetical protein
MKPWRVVVLGLSSASTRLDLAVKRYDSIRHAEQEDLQGKAPARAVML